MMRSALGLALIALLPVALADSGTRLCPTGYQYLGDDVELRGKEYTEVDRTPVYSCYKFVTGEKLNWLNANAKCNDDDAQLVSIEHPREAMVLQEKYYDMIKEDHDHDHDHDDDDDDDHDNDRDDRRKKTAMFFTSGMRFPDSRQWYWIGANRSVELEVNPGNVQETCMILVFTGEHDEPQLHAVGCTTSPFPFVCEARVQTVTYYTWFMANWVDFLLGFLLVVLFVALCVAVCSFAGSGDSNQRRSHHRRPRTTDPHVRHAVVDLPPSYDSSVGVHTVSGHSAAPAAAAGPSRYDYYRNKGKELLAKVYIYKGGDNSNATNKTSMPR